MNDDDRRLLEAALGLKAVDRAGWLRVGVEAPESVAAHTWAMALQALVLCPPELDRLRVLEIVIVHDLPEVQVGDLTPHDGVSKQEKQRREAAAADTLFAHHPHLRAAWQEYEDGRSPEARFVKALDKLDMALQARRYAAERPVQTDEFIDSARRRLAGTPWSDWLEE